MGTPFASLDYTQADLTKIEADLLTKQEALTVVNETSSTLNGVTYIFGGLVLTGGTLTYVPQQVANTLGDLANVNTSGLIAAGDVLTLVDDEGSFVYKPVTIPDQIQPALTSLTGGTLPVCNDTLGTKSLANSNVTSGVNQTTISGNLSIDSTLTANGGTGTAGQVLTSNGSSPAYWATAPSPTPTVLMAKGTGTQNTSGTITLWTNIVYDTSSGWTSSSNSYNAVVAGYYKIYLQVSLVNPATETRGTVAEIRKNGTGVLTSIQNFLDSTETGTEYMQNSADVIEYLAVGDSITGFVALGQGTAYLDGTRSCLNLFKIQG